MTTRPTRIAQTSTEAKKSYKKNGPTIPERQRRLWERGAELEQRAREIREREERGKAAKKRREEQKKKEMENRKRNGVGLATQLIGYRHTQAQLKNGMEAFLGLKKKRDEEKRKEMEVVQKLEAVMEEEATKEPWDDEADDAFDLPEVNPQGGDQWIDEDLDDDTLLEAHDLVMSDPVEETAEASRPPQLASSAPVAHSPRMVRTSKEDMDFIRLHGPINKATESILEKLPEPLVELLSQDTSIDPASWDPSPALLHKLHPPGLPPHRLRIKVGCIIMLLRDLNNSSSQLSKSQHLQVLRVEQERLECFVLDGQLEGTKTFLTRVTFPAKHRNEDKFPFRRIQFPIQVSKDFVAPVVTRETSQSSFKKPAISGRAPQRSHTSTKNPAPTPKFAAPMNRNPSFKLPGLPASRAKPPAVSKPTTTLPEPLLDGWDDFLDSGTQIARELSFEPKPHAEPLASAPNALPPLSTQDFDFSLEDLEDSPVLQPSNPQPSKLPPAKKLTWSRTPPKPSEALSSLNQHKPAESVQPTKQNVAASRPPKQAPLKRKFPEFLGRALANVMHPPKTDLPPSDMFDDGPTPKRMAFDSVQIYGAKVRSKAAAANAPGKSNPSSKTTGNKATSKVSTPGLAGNTQARTPYSFSDFGLSTQEAVLFFDDDDGMTFGSPPVAV